MIKEIKLENIGHKGVKSVIENFMERNEVDEVMVTVRNEDIGNGYIVRDRLYELGYKEGHMIDNISHVGTCYLRKISGKEGLIYNTLLVKK